MMWFTRGAESPRNFTLDAASWRRVFNWILLQCGAVLAEKGGKTGCATGNTRAVRVQYKNNVMAVLTRCGQRVCNPRKVVSKHRTIGFKSSWSNPVRVRVPPSVLFTSKGLRKHFPRSFFCALTVRGGKSGAALQTYWVRIARESIGHRFHSMNPIPKG